MQKNESAQHGTIGQYSKPHCKDNFGIIDAKGEAGIRLKNMKQGKRPATKYGNELRLMASEAELDDSSGGELLWGVMTKDLQNGRRASSEEYQDLETLAEWAIRKETNLATVRHIQ